ncbi:cation diffusion facilitator family transporter [Lysobacter sp. GCM10012299]|uniref:cation diffusion facilitator family transporter n=1 Tax=Lysobacter sp. GCM10012299 TaxID=3317333 RepID=UPI0036232271
MDTRPEQRLLKLSIGITIVVGVVGIASGLLVNSDAIIFDGMYSLVDVVLTVASLSVSRLVAYEGSRRFQFGYWHLEPMVEAFGGATLALSCLYAAFTAIIGLTSGGNEVSYGLGALWAGILCVVGMGMSAYMRGHARRLGSNLLALDARAWLVSGSLSLALLLGFAVAVSMKGAGHDAWVPFIDPAILLCIALAMLAVPMRSTWRAIREVLQVAPGDLDREVKQVMDEVVAEHGFLEYSSHVAKVGRGRFVEILILVPADHQIGPISRVDAIRRDIAARLGADRPQFWLTIEFTGDRSWM